jgi:hypothetical protein
MRTFLLVFLLVAMPVAAFADEYPIGDLAITYDPAHWVFEAMQAGDPLTSRAATANVRCIACRGDAFVTISIAGITREESEAVTDPMWARDRTQTTMTVGELMFGITTIHSPCRNYVPSSTTARVAYKGHTYTFHSGFVVGCHGSSAVGSERFEELLRGLHPRQ